MIDFLKELTRRKVWLFGGIYLALGWVLLQVAIAVETTLSLPGWVDQVTLVFMTIGFPFALLLAWAQENGATPQKSVESATPDLSEERPSFSIAVLHFDDLSLDRSLEDIADGIPEDILTRLSSEIELKVAARNSSFAFKGASPNIQDVGKQLAVRFVLEGSVRKIGDKVRVTAQLINALSGDHLWSEKYDHLIDNLDVTLDEAVSRIGSESNWQ